MRVLFIDGTVGYGPNRLEEKPTGGILTSLTIIPRLLASKGHEVLIKSLHDKDEVVAGVRFLAKRTPAPPTDIVVVNRSMLTAGILAQIQASGAVPVWWLHDIVDYRYMSDGSFGRVKNIISLSQYCTDTYSDFYGIPGDRFTVIPNGVDPSVWFPGPYENRNPNLFVFASAPIKGYQPLGFVMYNLQRHLPGLDFRVYSSQKLHDLEDGAPTETWLRLMGESGARVLPPIPQKELADVLRKAWCLLVPASYPEICSNLVLQAMACGLPIVASPTGSIPEWVEHRETGMLTKWLPHDKFSWWADFTRQVMELATNKDLHRHISETSTKTPLSWEQVGDRWGEYLNAKSGKLVSVC